MISKFLQKHNLPKSPLSICLIAKCIKNLLERYHLSCLFIYCLPHNAICLYKTQHIYRSKQSTSRKYSCMLKMALICNMACKWHYINRYSFNWLYLKQGNHAIAKMTAPNIWVPWKLYVSAKAADQCCARIPTLQSYHYSAVKLFSKYSNQCDHGT